MSTIIRQGALVRVKGVGSLDKLTKLDWTLLRFLLFQAGDAARRKRRRTKPEEWTK